MLKIYKPVESDAWANLDSFKLKLDWNESDYFLNKISDEILSFLNSSNISYYPNLDNSLLIEKVANYTNVTPDCIELTSGSDYAHEIILKYLGFLNRDSKVLIFYPTYDNFRSTAETIVSNIGIVNLELSKFSSLYDFDFSSSSLVYLSNPNNPTGDFLDIEKLNIVLDNNKDVLFVIDEAYIDFNISKSVVSLIEHQKNIIITRTFSKAFGLAGFRIGYILSSPILISSLSRFNNVKHLSSIAKIAASVTMDNISFFSEAIKRINFNKDILIKELKERDYVKNVFNGGGNFVLVELFDCSENFYLKLKSNNVYIRRLNHLVSLENFVRITVPSNNIDKLISCL